MQGSFSAFFLNKWVDKSAKTEGSKPFGQTPFGRLTFYRLKQVTKRLVDQSMVVTK
jgi:hypothetical protein